MIGYAAEYAKKYANIIKQYPNDPIVEVHEIDDPFEPNIHIGVIHASGVKRVYAVDRFAFKPSKPKRLRCEYCGRIALTDRPTCEGCGAVLPWEIDYEA